VVDMRSRRITSLFFRFVEEVKGVAVKAKGKHNEGRRDVVESRDVVSLTGEDDVTSAVDVDRFNARDLAREARPKVNDGSSVKDSVDAFESREDGIERAKVCVNVFDFAFGNFLFKEMRGDNV